MIQLFRKIRKEVMKTSQLTKYFFYVFGEILLVVVGILIALQINNRNEFRKERETERILLTHLKENVETNISEIVDVRDKVDQHILSITIVQEAISNDQSLHDSLHKHLGWALVYTTPTFNMGAYESFKMAGLNVMEDDQLGFEVTNFFEYDIGRTLVFSTEIRDDFYNYMLYFLRSEFKFYSNRNRRAIPLDFEDLKQNQEFALSLGIFRDVQIDLSQNLNNCLSSAQSLSALIDQRLTSLGEILD